MVNTRELDSKQQVELCAPCHSRRSELGDYDHREVALLDHQLPTLLEENLYHADGQILDEVYVWGSFTQSKMHQKGVRCSDCHDVHSLQHHVAGNALCLQCHRADAYDTKAHHFHKKIHEGKPSDGALCVKCHMPEQAYMVIDERADHSIRIPRPDLTKTIGTPNACSQNGCHPNETLDWVVDAFTKWYGQAKKPHYATALAAGIGPAAPQQRRGGRQCRRGTELAREWCSGPSPAFEPSVHLPESTAARADGQRRARGAFPARRRPDRESHRRSAEPRPPERVYGIHPRRSGRPA